MLQDQFKNHQARSRMSSQQQVHPKYHHEYALTDEYIAAVNRRAEVVHDFRCHHHDDDDDLFGTTSTASLVKVILGPSIDGSDEPVAFVIRNVLTPSECDDLIDASEDFGIQEGEKFVARTAKRTKNYTNADLSEKVERRITHVLDAIFKDPSEDMLLNNDNHRNEKENNEGRSNANTSSNSNTSKSSTSDDNKYMGPFHGIHNNWRIVRYDADAQDAFPAHQDQMDCFQKPKTNGSGRKDFIVSSHTLLLQLSKDDLQGGCTRFYPNAKTRLPAKQKAGESDNNEIASFRRSQFDCAVDVLLPRGWALVFKQRGLLHAGQPLSVSSPCSKYVAQAGVMRVLPEGILFKPSMFKNGLGVTNGAF